MKNRISLGVPCLVLLLAAGTAQAQLKFGFRLFAGPGYVGGGDLQKAVQGTAEGWDDLYSSSLNRSGEYKPFHLGMNLGGEILLHFSPSMAVGLGAEYLNASSDSEFSYTNGVSFETYWKPAVSAIPITLSFFYILPVSGRINVVAHAGAGLYLASLKLEDQFWFIADIQDEYDLSATGIGFHGGVGMEYAFSPSFAFVAELRGRLANVRGFKGDGTMRIPLINATDTTSGTMYFYRENGSDFYTFGDTEPSGGGISAARELGVAYSGFGILVGVKVSL